MPRLTLVILDLFADKAIMQKYVYYMYYVLVLAYDENDVDVFIYIYAFMLYLTYFIIFRTWYDFKAYDFSIIIP